MLNQFFSVENTTKCIQRKWVFSHVIHHLFHIIITCISFDSLQFSRYFIYFDVTYAANEDWPRVYVAKILLRFGINIDHQILKALYLWREMRTFSVCLAGFRAPGRQCATNAHCRLADRQVNIVLKCSNPTLTLTLTLINPKTSLLGLALGLGLGLGLGLEHFRTMFFCQSASLQSAFVRTPDLAPWSMTYQ